jgi:membrane protein YqaA with SNARE-associated domain
LVLTGSWPVSEVLVAFGPFGLFVVALLDSSFVPLPSSADALLILLTVAHPRWMLVYASIATIGSGVGCLILYYVSKRAGTRALARFSPAKQKRVRDLIERYDVLSVLIASLLPPPFPFKLFVVSAGVFNFSTTRFLIAILAGRGFRFLLEGYFAIRFGAQAKAVLAAYYPWIGCCGCCFRSPSDAEAKSRFGVGDRSGSAKLVIRCAGISAGSRLDVCKLELSRGGEVFDSVLFEAR